MRRINLGPLSSLPRRGARTTTTRRDAKRASRERIKQLGTTRAKTQALSACVDPIHESTLHGGVQEEGGGGGGGLVPSEFSSSSSRSSSRQGGGGRCGCARRDQRRHTRGLQGGPGYLQPIAAGAQENAQLAEVARQQRMRLFYFDRGRCPSKKTSVTALSAFLHFFSSSAYTDGQTESEQGSRIHALQNKQ
jgi:hypothetical protein